MRPAHEPAGCKFNDRSYKYPRQERTGRKQSCQSQCSKMLTRALMAVVLPN